MNTLQADSKTIKIPAQQCGVSVRFSSKTITYRVELATNLTHTLPCAHVQRVKQLILSQNHHIKTLEMKHYHAKASAH